MEKKRRFFTADHHFGHANILKYQPNRWFKDVDSMNSGLVDAWNAVVSEKDEVYCLGDMSYKFETLREHLPYMNGRKVWIFGNHDPVFKPMLSGDRALVDATKKKAIREGFAEIHRELEIQIEGIGVVKMSHFPYWPASTEGLENHELRYPDLRPQQGREALLLHGHVHSNWLMRRDDLYPAPMLNVGVDVWNMRPVSETEIEEKFNQVSVE